MQMLLEALAYGDHFWNINLGDLAVVNLFPSQALPFILIFDVIAVGLDLLPKRASSAPCTNLFIVQIQDWRIIIPFRY